MHIILGSDHAGYKAKERMKRFLTQQGISFEDLGATSENPVDYPDIAHAVTKKLLRSSSAQVSTANTTAKKKSLDSTFGVLICGSGTGMAMAANRVQGIRAALIYDAYSAKMARNDNDANVATFRARGIPIERNVRLLAMFLKTPFSKLPRHKRRVAKLDTRRT